MLLSMTLFMFMVMLYIFSAASFADFAIEVESISLLDQVFVHGLSLTAKISEIQFPMKTSGYMICNPVGMLLC